MNWQAEIEEVLTQTNIRRAAAIDFLELVDRVNPPSPSPRWQEVFNDIFGVLSERYQPWQLYPLIFKMGMVWQQYRSRLEREI